jgi:hypothetical protein
VGIMPRFGEGNAGDLAGKTTLGMLIDYWFNAYQTFEQIATKVPRQLQHRPRLPRAT